MNLYNIHLPQLQGKVGKVKYIKDSGDLLVVYNAFNSAFLLNPEAVVKVRLSYHALMHALNHSPP